jgi:hypothetical protein
MKLIYSVKTLDNLVGPLKLHNPCRSWEGFAGTFLNKKFISNFLRRALAEI